MIYALRHHWPEYLMEAAGLGIFMISASVFDILLEYTGSPVRQAISSALLRRILLGIMMGLTAIAIIYSPWGKQSGAQLNPAVTLAFFRLGKIYPWDALFYITGQFLGGLSGVLLVAAVLGKPLASPNVNYIVTVPRSAGPGAAFVGEVCISFGLMFVVLVTSNRPQLSRLTGVFAGMLIALYVSVEAPLSGMSMNPARTFASALPAHRWTAVWIYFAAPILGMLLAAETYIRSKAAPEVICAKLHHDYIHRCIFRCGYARDAVETDPPAIAGG